MIDQDKLNSVRDRDKNRRTFKVVGAENGYITTEGDTEATKVFTSLGGVIRLMKGFFSDQPDQQV